MITRLHFRGWPTVPIAVKSDVLKLLSRAFHARCLLPGTAPARSAARCSFQRAAGYLAAAAAARGSASSLLRMLEGTAPVAGHSMLPSRPSMKGVS